MAILVWSTVLVSGQSGQPAEGYFIEAEGARLFVRTVGSGKPLIIVHGGPGMSHDYLAPQFIDLLGRDYQLIFYDQRASGRSTGVEDTTRVTMAQFVRDLEILRQQLKLDQVDLLGHSFGGLLAMYYAIAYPQNVHRMLLLDSAPASWELNFPHFRKTIAERQTEQDRQEQLAIEKSAGFGKSPELMDRYFKLYFKTFFKDPAQTQRLFLGIDEQWIMKFNATNNRIWNDLGKYDIHDRLPKIAAPTMVVYCDASVLDVKGSEAIAQRIPGARLVVLKDVGHFPYIEAPDVFRKTVKECFGK
jgi:proline iminopeptidase